MHETIDYLRRILQVAGKYSLDELFETGWGHIVFTVTPRGLLSPVFRRNDVTFQVEYRLIDGDVRIVADAGLGSISLEQRSVADFYRTFTRVMADLGLPAPGSPIASELPAPRRLDNDERSLPWSEPDAREILRAFHAVARGLDAWQAPWRGQRTPVGVMWGGFDLCTSRYLPRELAPDRRRPPFLQWGMTDWCVTVGFDLEADPGPALYAYIAPQPADLDSWQWQVPGTVWDPEKGLIALAWDETSADPASAIVRFADDVYSAAIELAGWPAELVRERFDGWQAGRIAPPNPSEYEEDQ